MYSGHLELVFFFFFGRKEKDQEQEQEKERKTVHKDKSLILHRKHLVEVQLQSRGWMRPCMRDRGTSGYCLRAVSQISTWYEYTAWRNIEQLGKPNEEAGCGGIEMQFQVSRRTTQLSSLHVFEMHCRKDNSHLNMSTDRGVFLLTEISPKPPEEWMLGVRLSHLVASQVPG